MPSANNAVIKSVGFAWHDGGACVLPAASDGTKRPAVPWAGYQQNRPDRGELAKMLDGADGIGIVTGAVSGGIEMFELEGAAVADGLHEQLRNLVFDAGHAELWEKLLTYVERTPKGGLHWLFRVAGAPVAGNTKLAKRPRTPTPDDPSTVETLIETRGEGGWTVIAPSNGTTHETGKPWQLLSGSPGNIATLTADEVQTLHRLARTFDEMPELPPPAEPRATPRAPGDLTPGDDFNQRADWADLLKPAGWVRIGTRGGVRYWRRPGKNVGISATTGYGDQGRDLLYVFTTSTEFDAERSYSKFGAHALLQYHGNFADAARALRREGYGSPPQRPVDPLQDVYDRLSAGDNVTGETPPPSGASSPSTELEDELWKARPILGHLHTYARARGVAPLAVLGAALGRTMATVPPNWVLPPIIGGYGSLNLFVAMVGPSGAGKGASHAVAAEAIDLSDWRDPISGEWLRKTSIGSGEGMVRQYVHRDKGGQIQQLIACLLMDVPEVDSLTALGARQGATLTQKLREAYSGEALDFSAYADQAKALRVPGHAYRATLLLGVQPLRAGPLLDDADGGLPQRFLWVPVVDPTMPRPEQWPEPPGPLKGSTVAPPPRPGQRDAIRLAPVIATEVREAHYRRARGDTDDELDGHRMQTRVKVAAGLALLDGHLTVEGVTADDWHLSGVLMAISDRTRDTVRADLAEQAGRGNVAKGRAAGEQEVVKAEVVDRSRIAGASRAVLHALGKKPGEWVGYNDLRRAIAHRWREHLLDALEHLELAGQVENEQHEYHGQAGRRHRVRP